MALEHKLSAFLSSFKDETVSQFTTGVCNAFAFMNFRADVTGTEDINLKRMHQLLAQKDSDLVTLGSLYKNYKEARLQLIENVEGSEKIPQLNLDINQCYEKLRGAREQLKTDAENPTLKATIKLHEQQLKELRKQRDELVEQKLKDQFGSEQWQKIQVAEEIYTYIHTIIAVFHPGIFLNFQARGKMITQNDYVEILQILSDGIASEHTTAAKTKIQKASEVAFVFTEKELSQLFDNVFDKNTIRDGDYVRLADNEHAIYLSVKNGKFRLFDPELVDIEPNTPAVLAAVIKKRFAHPGINELSSYIPIAISIFEKTEESKSEVPRPQSLAIVETILKNRNDPDINGKAWDDTTAIWMAACYGHTDVVKELISKGAELDIIDNQGWSAACVAALNGRDEVVALLVEAGADFELTNKQGDTPACLAASYGHAEVIRKLAKKGDLLDLPNRAGHTPAIIAAIAGHANVITALAEAGVRFDMVDKKTGRAVIHYAAIRGHANVIEAIAATGADLDKKGPGGFTAAHLAAQKGYANVIDALHKAGANLNIATGDGLTPAHIAAQKNHANVIKSLFEAGVDLNRQNINRETPLHLAIQAANYAAIKRLLDCGANTSLKDFRQQTPLDYASSDVKAFLILQDLKKYLAVHQWEGARPELVNQQLKRIAAAEKNDKWAEALDDIMGMAAADVHRAPSQTLFAPKKQETYLQWFASEDLLKAEVSKALANESPPPSPKLTA